jgi:uncharacterized membrane protein YkvA (DUF1232 family)
MSPGLSKLSPKIRRIVDQLRGEALVPLHVLAGELAGYTNELDKHVGNTEFYDLDTARRAATLCHKLLAALPEKPDEEQHRLVQLAINYFVLAEDANDDNHSLIGFDDDLQVVVAAIEDIGFSHLLQDATNSQPGA